MSNIFKTEDTKIYQNHTRQTKKIKAICWRYREKKMNYIIYFFAIIFNKGNSTNTIKDNINTTVITYNLLRTYGYAKVPETTEHFPDEMLKDLNEINMFTNDALAWFNGQFIKAVLKPNNKTFEFLKKKRQKSLLNRKPFFG